MYMPHLQRASAANRAARGAVREYYDHCWNDYRILWRTDENGSIHFGFFDPNADQPPSFLSALKAALSTGGAIVMAIAAGLAAATGTGWGRDQAVRCLRVAARGRASRHDRAQARMIETCAQAVDLQRGERVLDAGCGVGGTDLWLAERFDVQVVGLNIQPMHLAEARRLALSHRAGHGVRFSMQDFTEMAIADNRFDVVWALESACHCTDKMAFIGEAHRVLQPGGRLMVADFFRVHDELEDEEEKRLKIWTEGWALPNLASVSGFQVGLESTGFQKVVYRDIAAQVLPSSRRLYRASLVAMPINALLERTGARSATQGRNVRAAFEQYRTLRSRSWTYGIVVATKP
ncbi:MAG: SAM-dependent methyltransferase [Vicinamibacterales bacterium]